MTKTLQKLCAVAVGAGAPHHNFFKQELLSNTITITSFKGKTILGVNSHPTPD